MKHIHTPETNAAIESENADPWDLAADLERRLTIARKALRAVRSMCLNMEQAENVAEKALELTKPKS